jgi:hypothetical protein
MRVIIVVNLDPGGLHDVMTMRVMRMMSGVRIDVDGLSQASSGQSGRTQFQRERFGARHEAMRQQRAHSKRHDHPKGDQRLR